MTLPAQKKASAAKDLEWTGYKTRRDMHEQSSPSVKIRQSEQPWHSSPLADPIEERRRSRRRKRAALVGSSSTPARAVLWCCRGIPSLFFSGRRGSNFPTHHARSASRGAFPFSLRPFLDAAEASGTHIPLLGSTGSAMTEFARLLLSVFWRERGFSRPQGGFFHKGSRPGITAK